MDGESIGDEIYRRTLQIVEKLKKQYMHDKSYGIENQSWIMDMISNIIIEVLSSFAEVERDMIRERQREGIELGIKQGKYSGRKKGTSKVNDKEFLKIHKQCQDGGITVDQAIKLLGYKSRTSYYRKAKEFTSL